MSFFSSFNPKQKEAVGLLQIGTFLEYFDLMLYVHMAVLLNELFYPQTDPHTAAILSSFAFCSTFVFRPFGALLFGWVGDNIGRKTTVILTTMLMSLTCVTMANLPTYVEIGVAASWIFTICRVVQGMSSMGELIGCQIYVTEITQPPIRYPAVAFLWVAADFGAVVALGIAILVTSMGVNWRSGFFVGSALSVFCSLARTSLSETQEFLSAKKQIRKSIGVDHRGISAKYAAALESIDKKFKARVNKKTAIACFLIYCGWPLSFYLSFQYFNPILKANYGFTGEDIILRNFFLALVMVSSNCVWAKLSQYIYPLKLITLKVRAFCLFSLLFPILSMQATHSHHLFALQSLALMISLSSHPADPLFIKYFPVFKRFTTTSFLYALSRAIVYVVTSFGLFYCTDIFGHWGVWGIMLPIAIGFYWSVKYFKNLTNSKQKHKLSAVNFAS